MNNDKIELENYRQLFENNKLMWKSDDFGISCILFRKSQKEKNQLMLIYVTITP